MSIEDVFKRAAIDGQLVSLVDQTGSERTIEPYMIYSTSKGKRCFHCYQLDGVSKSGNPIGWKNPEVDSFVTATILIDTFTIRLDYNPGNNKMFPIIEFHL